MNKLSVFGTILLFLGISWVHAQVETQPRNIIFILTDDHRYDYMGFTGKVPWLETPNMDALASNGAYLPNAFVTTSLCSPSRASILTGMYSHTHTIVDNQAPDPGNLTYFPTYLQASGYQTGFFGNGIWAMIVMIQNLVLTNGKVLKDKAYTTIQL